MENGNQPFRCPQSQLIVRQQYVAVVELSFPNIKVSMMFSLLLAQQELQISDIRFSKNHLSCAALVVEIQPNIKLKRATIHWLIFDKNVIGWDGSLLKVWSGIMCVKDLIFRDNEITRTGLKDNHM